MARFEIDLRSNAIVEAFGAQLEEARDFPAEAKEQGKTQGADGVERITLPVR